MSKKVQLGQFFTVNNPFELQPFKDWFFSIPDWQKSMILEPFAGSNNIVKMINVLAAENGFKTPKWKCFDIDPPTKNVAPEYPVQKHDSISDYSTHYKIAITNPPYLAKNSATRKGITYRGGQYEDLYQACVSWMLQVADYVAAIIPESFITSGLFIDRLSRVISLTSQMFDDTDCPVCLALFNPASKSAGSGHGSDHCDLNHTASDQCAQTQSKPSKRGAKTTRRNSNNATKQSSFSNVEPISIWPDFEIYQNNRLIGKYSKLQNDIPIAFSKANWKMNDPHGSVGCICIDSTSGPSIRFVLGATIDSSDIIVSSRAITRISGLPNDIDLDKFIRQCNKVLTQFRNKTGDVFLTSFKGLRKDGKYRRRLDFKMIRSIMNTALNQITKKYAL